MTDTTNETTTSAIMTMASLGDVTEAEILRLPQRFRALVQLALGGNKYREIASALNLPLGTVRSRLNRAKVRILRGRTLPTAAEFDAESKRVLAMIEADEEGGDIDDTATVAAFNAFNCMVEASLGARRMGLFEEWCLKATRQEIIEEGTRRAKAYGRFR